MSLSAAAPGMLPVFSLERSDQSPETRMDKGRNALYCMHEQYAIQAFSKELKAFEKRQRRIQSGALEKAPQGDRSRHPFSDPVAT
jgi:hypothetical protein